MGVTSIQAEDVCYLIITYNPSVQDLKFLINRLEAGNGMIYIVDNSTERDIQDIIHGMGSDLVNVTTLKRNFGIAAAQNIGMKLIFKRGFKGVLLLDQDSHFTNEMLLKLCSTYNNLAKTNNVGCLGPLAYDVDIGESDLYNDTSLVRIDPNVVEVEKTLSSGSLITKEAYNQVGEMDEELFIDLVDWEWCWRARSKGYRIFIDKSILMPHKLGEGRKKVIFNIKVGRPAPIRHYYQFRNYLLLSRRSYVPFTFKYKYFGIYTLKFFYYGIYLKPRIRRINYMLKGIKDGITKNNKFNM